MLAAVVSQLAVMSQPINLRHNGEATSLRHYGEVTKVINRNIVAASVIVQNVLTYSENVS